MDNFLSPINDVRVVDSNHLLCASLSAEHGEDTSSTADVKNNLVLENMLVLVNEITIGVGADSIFQHRFVDCFGKKLATELYSIGDLHTVVGIRDKVTILGFLMSVNGMDEGFGVDSASFSSSLDN